MARRGSRAALLAVVVLVVVAALALVAVRLLDDQPTAAKPEDPVDSRAGEASAPVATNEPTPDAYPDADTTGVPPGTELTPYVGPCTLTETVELVAVDATDVCPAIVVQAASSAGSSFSGSGECPTASSFFAAAGSAVNFVRAPFSICRSNSVSSASGGRHTASSNRHLSRAASSVEPRRIRSASFRAAST